MRLVTLLTLLLGIAAVAPGGEAHAGEARFRFVYVRAPGAEACPDELGMRQEIERRLGRAAFAGTAHDTLICRIEPHGAGLRAVITVVDTAGPGRERVLDSPRADCADLAEAMELALALAIDPTADVEAPATDADPSRLPAALVAQAPKADAAPARLDSVVALAPAARSGAAPRGLVRVGLAVDAGSGPGPGLAAALGAGVRTGRWLLALELGGSWSTSAAALGGDVRTQLFTAMVTPCAALGRFVLCGLAGAGALRGQGQGFEGARRGAALWAGGGVRLGWQLAVAGRTTWVLQAQAVAPIVGARLLVGDQEAWRSPGLAAALGLGITFE